MVTKVYSLKRKFSAYYETVYCGVKVPLSFTVGAGNEGVRRSELVTKDKFTQDAIENDPRFGHDFFLSGVYNENNEYVENDGYKAEEPVVVVRRTRAEIEAEAKAKAEVKVEPVAEVEPEVVAKPKKSRGKKTTAQTAVKTFPTINDAVYYLENELGVSVDVADIDALLKEHNLAVEA